MATIGLIELPAFKLLDARGDNWTAFRSGDPLGGKQILAGTLEAGGHEVRLINLKAGHDHVETGSTVWNGLRLTKVVAGRIGRQSTRAAPTSGASRSTISRSATPPWTWCAISPGDPRQSWSAAPTRWRSRCRISGGGRGGGDGQIGRRQSPRRQPPPRRRAVGTAFRRDAQIW